MHEEYPLSRSGFQSGGNEPSCANPGRLFGQATIDPLPRFLHGLV